VDDGRGGGGGRSTREREREREKWRTSGRGLPREARAEKRRLGKGAKPTVFFSSGDIRPVPPKTSLRFFTSPRVAPYPLATPNPPRRDALDFLARRLLYPRADEPPSLAAVTTTAISRDDRFSGWLTSPPTSGIPSRLEALLSLSVRDIYQHPRWRHNLAGGESRGGGRRR
jgi:hypothetical protein